MRGGASPAYSAAPKSRELSAPFERRGCALHTTPGARGGASSAYYAVPKSPELLAPHLEEEEKIIYNPPPPPPREEKVSMKRAILCAFHLAARTKVQKIRAED